MKKPPIPMSSRAWSRENIAWAGGFFEGEGCLTTMSRRRGMWRISITSTDRDVIDRWASIFPGGRIYTPSMDGRPRSNKQQHIWQLNGNRRVYPLMMAIWPWLGQRRRERVADFLRERV